MIRAMKCPTFYLLITANRANGPLSAKLGEVSFVPGQFTQAVLELSAEAPFHNAIYIITPLQDFIAWCEVAVSDDARTWRIVNSRSPIFRFQKNNQTGVQKLHYPQTNARFMRLRIFNSESQFPIEGATVFYSVTLPADEVLAPVDWKPETKRQRTSQRVDRRPGRLAISAE